MLAPYAAACRSASSSRCITYLSLIIGELVPKRIGLNHPETIASWVARPMQALARIGGPLVSLLTGSTNLVLRLFGIKGQAEPHLTEDEIRAVISQGAESGALEETEESLVQRVFRVGDQRVAAIMTPRLDIEWVDVDATDDELREFLAATATASSWCATVARQRARHGARGRPAAVAMKDAPITLRSLIREALFVPDSMPASSSCSKRSGVAPALAIVIDEFGAVEGLVTVDRPARGVRRRACPPTPASERRDRRRAPTAAGWSTARRRSKKWRATSASTSCRKAKPARITRWAAS